MCCFDSIPKQNPDSTLCTKQNVRYALNMEIYIEDFILQNSLINMCLLRLTQLTTKNQTNLFKIIFASIIGTGFNVLCAGFVANAAIINLLKVVCAFVMLKICFKISFKQVIGNMLLLFAYTLALCGLVDLMCGGSNFSSGGIMFANNIHLWQVLTICLVGSYLLGFVSRQIKLKLNLSNLIYPITLKQSGNSLSVQAFLDTGNMLNIYGQPVLVLDLDSYLRLTKQTYIDYLLKQNSHNSLNLQTVSGCNKLNLYQVEELQITINHKTKIIDSAMVAVSNQKFSSGNYQALLSPAFL